MITLWTEFFGRDSRHSMCSFRPRQQQQLGALDGKSGDSDSAAELVSVRRAASHGEDLLVWEERDVPEFLLRKPKVYVA